jgi:rhamnose utilization protein RhaD (predicted bifunctional aldolase and dehydrogenase)
MQQKKEILDQLIELSHWLGEERREIAILGEGNTSAKISPDTFFVKASGAQLGTISQAGIVEVSAPAVLKMLSGPALGDKEIKERLSAAAVNNPSNLMPSIETLFHAYLLSLPGVNFVGHTHPVSVNRIMCSKGWKECTQGRLFPDEIVCCGIAPVHIEYTDPGVTLGRKIKEEVVAYINKYGVRPKSILMQNHGLIAIGATVAEVKSTTAMWDKTAKVLAGAFQFGGPNYLSEEQVDRICSRPDEEARKKMIEGLK